MFTVVTSFSPEGWTLYAMRFVETFRQFWPSSVRLICAWEGDNPADLDGFDLLRLQPCASFLARHADNLIVQGRSQSSLSPWGEKARKEGYSFHHDAYKFARKVFAIAHTAREVENGKLFWIDADVVTHHFVVEGLLHDLLPDPTDLCYLWRRNCHSELGFVGYNLDHVWMHDFLAEYERMYADDRFLTLKAWDDCHVFDYLVDELRPACGLIRHNSQGHPFDDSILGNYMTHLKGKRKAA